MIDWPLSAIQRAVGGDLCGPDRAIAGVSTDTRTVAPGQLFVALRGERFDGHDFLEQAVAAGAGALLVTDGARIPAGASALVVADTRLALGRLAAAWRAGFEIPVIAVTGSNGKTTTKEMIAAIQEETVRRLYSVRIQRNEEIKRERVAKGMTENVGGDGTVKKRPTRVVKVGRNDPCPCGSGLKWKKCTCKEYHP